MGGNRPCRRGYSPVPGYRRPARPGRAPGAGDLLQPDVPANAPAGTGGGNGVWIATAAILAAAAGGVLLWKKRQAAEK